MARYLTGNTGLIDVNETLPEIGKCVIVYAKYDLSDVPYIDELMGDEKSGFMYDIAARNKDGWMMMGVGTVPDGYLNIEVRAWSPLPQHNADSTGGKV